LLFCFHLNFPEQNMGPGNFEAGKTGGGLIKNLM